MLLQPKKQKYKKNKKGKIKKLNYSSNKMGIYPIDVIKCLLKNNKADIKKYSVLEIGSNIGTDSINLLKIFKNITSIELIEKYIQAAVKNIYFLDKNLTYHFNMKLFFTVM